MSLYVVCHVMFVVNFFMICYLFYAIWLFCCNMATFFMQYGYLFLFQKTLYLNKIEPPSLHKKTLCQAWLKLGKWFWRFLWMIFKFCQCTFSISLLLSPLALEKIFLLSINVCCSLYTAA